MAKDKEKEITLIDAFKDFKEEKSIDRPVMLGVLKDVFLTQLAKTYGSADNFDVIINVDKGDCEIYQNFEVVEEVENPATEITVDEIAAETGDDDYEIGDTYTRKLSLSSFGRRGILNIRQNLQGRIMDIATARARPQRARPSQLTSPRSLPCNSTSTMPATASSASQPTPRIWAMPSSHPVATPYIIR